MAVSKADMARGLTQLSEDEELFQASVREFAKDRIAPLVRGMDESQQFDNALLKQLFELGLMGIEIPEEHGGAAGTFFEAILAVEAISAVDPSVGVLVDVQNTLCINALNRWANDSQKKRSGCRGWQRIPSAPTPSARQASGSDAFALQTRAVRRSSENGDGEYVLNGQKLWITNAKEAGLFIVFATLDPALGYKGITAFMSSKKVRTWIRAGQERRQARHSRVEHLRTDLH